MEAHLRKHSSIPLLKCLVAEPKRTIIKKPGQMTFVPRGSEAYRKAMRREPFLADMDRVVPRNELVALVGPPYAKGTSGPG